VLPCVDSTGLASLASGQRSAVWSWGKCVLVTGTFYLASLLLVLSPKDLLSVVCSAGRDGDHSSIEPAFRPLYSGNCRDYARIAESGYTYRKEPLYADTVFFPGLPILAKAVSGITGMGPRKAILLVSHCALFVASIVLMRLASETTFGLREDITFLTGALLFVCPSSIFLLQARPESLFVALEGLVLFACWRRWSLWTVVILAGCMTAVRPVGVVVSLVALWHVFVSRRVPLFTSKASVLSLSAFWGVIAYVLYLWWRFGDPWSFATAQSRWNRVGDITLAEKMVSLISLRPVIASLTEVLRDAGRDGVITLVLTVSPLNSILFVLSALAVCAAVRRGMWSGESTILASGLLVVPYVMRGIETQMAGHARFCAVILPLYVYCASFLARAPATVKASVIVALAVWQKLLWIRLGAFYEG
jgi:hypothetical protein